MGIEERVEEIVDTILAARATGSHAMVIERVPKEIYAPLVECLVKRLKGEGGPIWDSQELASQIESCDGNYPLLFSEEKAPRGILLEKDHLMEERYDVFSLLNAYKSLANDLSIKTYFIFIAPLEEEFRLGEEVSDELTLGVLLLKPIFIYFRGHDLYKSKFFPGFIEDIGEGCEGKKRETLLKTF